MLRILEDESTIRRCQQQFMRRLKAFADDRVQVRIGHMGESFGGKVFCATSLGFWFIPRKQDGNRYWNAFGVGRPSRDTHVFSTCEINFPLRGLDRRIGGAFARDEAGRTFVVHRGKIGGGKKGIGKSLFEDQYRGVWAVVQDGSVETNVVLIGHLGSSRFAWQVSQFVRKVDRIKDAGSPQRVQTEMEFDDHRFSEEWIGGRYQKEERDFAAECDRGLVIRDLAAALKNCGVRLGNDGDRDLYAVDAGGRVTMIFEVKTDLQRPNLCAGAARLLLNGLSLPNQPRLVMAVPGGVDDALREKFKALKVDLLPFEWEDDHAVFGKLKDILPPA
ncbi:MAG TPA: hypothetical protein PLR20_07240 [Syntrophales bacterium]|nr:hypothetical protein [Syntrophales bacterium]HOX95147.1 hypothetical protein [Syntrophales bacterium]HPI56453.1 hypothetical protein [Syntrophales bacterium]HPN25126.1 hypothetical protein [Syntrophales bacterium]HQM29131.1 hypothetical protein [Syntrophales bacterium]